MQEGVIGGSATLNVFESKPDVPLEPFSMDNIVLSAHRAVATLTPLSIRDVIELVVGNLTFRKCSVSNL